MAVSRRLRFEVLRRDGHACRYCGAKAPDVVLTVDHVIPVALGGGDEPNNLVTACAPCNGGKSSVPVDAALVEDVDATALLFARAIERASDLRRAEAANLRQQLATFHDLWAAWRYSDGTPVSLPEDWGASVERFLVSGLSVEDMRPLIEGAMTHPRVRDEFRMFCRKAWDEIGVRQEMARRLIEDGTV